MGNLDKMEIQKEEKAVVVAPVTAVAEVKEPSKLQQINSDFEGIGEGGFAARVVLDGTQLLYKDEDRAVDVIRVRLTGGRKVHQYFDEASNTYHKSYDGKFTEDGESIREYPDMRHMFELDWEEEVDGEMTEHQMVLSPTGRHTFEAYAKKLAKMQLSVGKVVTIITATRQQNKDGQRYSRPEFTCQELIDASN